MGGSGVRIRLSNLFGAAPVTIGPVHVGAHGNRSAILAGTDHEVTFQGRPSVTIAPGADVISDPVRFSVSPLEEIAVSVYVPLGAGPSTIHSDGIQTAYITSGNDTAATSLHDPRFASIAVVNAGIAGNRLLTDGPVGPSALARFDRDALDKSGVRWVVLFEGINDKVNAWIRGAGAFDAVVDFDKAVRDPAAPERILPAIDGGDHLHLNDAGYKAMAEAIDVQLLVHEK